MSDFEAFRAVILQSLDSCRDDEGVIDLDKAAAKAAEYVCSVAWVKPDYTNVSWDRLVASVVVDDPYTVMSPEERATFPLSNDMIAQNVRLLEALLDELMSETELVKPKKDRVRKPDRYKKAAA